MSTTYDLTRLNTESFEHMINMIALRVLGDGHTGFGPGPDGGRDGYFEGEAPYPSKVTHWSGTWYIQSKFHRPHLSKDPQKWLIEQITGEISEFNKPSTARIWPNNWIVASNIDPSGTPETGSFDKCRELVKKARPSINFHIWGGRKILDYLSRYQDIADYYYEFLAPGHILKSIIYHISDSQAHTNHILRHFIVAQFEQQQYTKLEQAGSTADTRPGIHHLFTDLPFTSPPSGLQGMGACYLAKTLANNHRDQSLVSDSPEWRAWRRQPSRARIWFIKGGPGQGKSTLTQYVCQIQRAALILDPAGPNVLDTQRHTANDIHRLAEKNGLWPLLPRVPVSIELKDFAQWLGKREERAKGVLSYLSERLAEHTEQPVLVGTLKRLFSTSRWLFIFDGLDEVPSDVKDHAAQQVIRFCNDVLVEIKSDAMIVCTSRPQGYSGQFSALDAATIELSKLLPDQALSCAAPVLRIDRSHADSTHYFDILKEALQFPAVQEIMTTPLQAHIMAVVVRNGGKPPDRKWQLYTTFYGVIKQREANRSLAKPSLARILREEDKLLKAIHNRLGFELHKMAETSKGAQTFLTKQQFEAIALDTVEQLQDTNISETVSTLMEATTDRLVLVNTPESGSEVRFDIRPLQEFFAAEYIYESVTSDKLSSRLRVIGGDSHWKEVMHFLLSALIENGRQTELTISVQVLTELNGGTADNDTRLAYRRLAIGSIICARLLEEGVLEQDKRVRQQFRECLEPVLGCSEATESLIRLDNAHSKSWLLGVLRDQLLEKAEVENIGAAIVLACMLPEDQEVYKTVIQYLTDASMGYRACIFETVAKRNDIVPDWTIKYAIRSLMDEHWLEMGDVGIRAAISLIKGCANVSELCTQLGVPVALSAICPVLLGSYDRGRDEAAGTRVLFGVLKKVLHAPVAQLDHKSWSEELWAALRDSTGIFKVFYNIFQLAACPTDDNMRALLTSVGDRMEVMNYFPNYVTAWIRKDLQLQSGKDQSWLINDTDRPGFSWDFALADGNAEQRWDLFLENIPHLATEIICGIERRAILLKNPKNQESLLSGLKKDPKAGSALVTLWGELEEYAPTVRASLAEIIREDGEEPDPDLLWLGVLSQRKFIEVKLPAEANLLPHIVNAMAESFAVTGYVSSVAFDIDGVLTVLQGDYSNSVKGAASVIYLLHPKKDEKLSNSIRDGLLEYLTPENAQWYARAAASALYSGVVRREVSAMSVMAKLHYLIRHDFINRNRLNPIMASVRQTSTAPVGSCENAEIWKY